MQPSFETPSPFLRSLATAGGFFTEARGQEFERFMKESSVFNSPMKRRNLQYEGMPFDEPDESLCDVLMSLAADQEHD